MSRTTSGRVTGCPERGSLRATPSPVYGYVHVEDEAAFHNAVSIPPAVQALRQSRFPRFGEDSPSSNRWQSGYLCSGGQQFFGKRANQPGIDTGKFIDLLPDTPKIIVIAGVFSGLTDVTYRSKPGCQLSVRVCACSQLRVVRLTGGEQILQSAHYSTPSMSLFSVLAISACAVAALSTLNICSGRLKLRNARSASGPLPSWERSTIAGCGRPER
ncbi:Uncharacterised protein [Raoultella terrigena]|uniref:Uncharacterized protein n=1 Tax=Raoultella terrigena TaxID=577 RepID=A0A3P8JQF2_RAOTE|nr:Uncharacterised protein [Raoultella terrigena]